MKKAEVVCQIQQLFEEACTDLFASLNCDVAALETTDVDFDDVPIACVEANSSEIEFLIALQLPLSVLTMTYPVLEGITLIGEDRLEDWISELSNQLMGRIKRKLTSHECHVDIGLPSTYFGAELDTLLESNHERKTFYFDVDGETCACTIALEVYNDATSYSIEENEHERDQNEGELELF